VQDPLALDAGEGADHGAATSARDDQPAIGTDPWQEKQSRRPGSSNRLGHPRVVRSGGERLGPSSPRFDILKAELSDRQALKVMAPLSRFHEEELALGMQDGEGESGKSEARAQIYERFDGLWECSIQGGCVKDEMPHDLLARPMPG